MNNRTLISAGISLAVLTFSVACWTLVIMLLL